MPQPKKAAAHSAARDAVPERKSLRVVNEVGGMPMFVPDHGVVQPTGHASTVPDSDDLQFLLACGSTLRLATKDDADEPALSPDHETPTEEGE